MLFSAISLSLILAQGQTRDLRAVPLDTAAIRGVVYSTATGAPLRDAMVVLVADRDASDLRGTFAFTASLPGRDVAGRRPTIAPSDAAGRFEFSGLPAGAYRVVVTAGPNRGRYLPAGYGASRPNDAGRIIVLSPGQTFSDANIGLVTASAIEGRVVDDTGEPVTGATVTAMRFRLGRVERAPAAPSQTDDLGRFRVYGLEPGAYLVAAESDHAARAAAGREAEGFVTTYHPSSASDAAAVKVQVPPSQDVIGVDIQLVRSRRFNLAGTIVNSLGQPVTSSSVVLARSTLGGSSNTHLAVDAAGRFSAHQIDPGDYWIDVWLPTQSSGTSRNEFASVPVTVQGDLEDLVLTAQPGSTINGRVVFADGVVAARQALIVNVLGFEARSHLRNDSRHPVDPELRFTLKDLFGPKLVRFAALPEGWALSAVMYGGRDIADVPTAFSGDLGELQMVVTTRPATLEGVVRDNRGTAVADATVVIFSEDRASWTGSSLRLRTVPVDQSGRFALRQLPAGNYLAVAVPRGDFRIPRGAGGEFFAILSADATALSLNDDERRAVDLRLSRSIGLE